MARKRSLLLDHLLTILRANNLKFRLVTIQPKFKRWVIYGSMACLSTLFCVVGLPAIARGSMPNVTATQTSPNPSSSFPEFRTETLAFFREVRGNLTQAVSLEQQAKNLYAVGRYSEAVRLLKQALKGYQELRDTIGQAVVLSNLALCYQQLGTWQKATPAIAQALDLLKVVPKDTPEQWVAWAQVLDVLGNLQLAEGKTEKAVDAWEESANLYNQLGDSTHATRSRINQAQALQALGLYRQAILTLKNVKKDLQFRPDSLAKAENLRSLGDALRGIGNLACNHKESPLNSDCIGATEVLGQSLEIAKKLQSPEAIAAANLSLGNVAWTESKMARERGGDAQANCQEVNSKTEEASRFYQQAIAQSVAPFQTQAQLNYLRLLIELEKWSEAQKLYPEVQKQIANLPPGRSQIYAQVNLATSLRKLRTRNQENGTLTTPDAEEINQILAIATQEAERLKDVRSQALVLKEQGQLYQQIQKLLLAENLTRQALNLSQSIQSSEISYQAASQLGHILKTLGKTEEALAAYTQAYETLKSGRSDLMVASSDVQFAFRESVEPVYREFAELLLQPSSQTTDSSREKPKKLSKASEVLESFEVAELQNYLQQVGKNVPLQLDKLLEQAEQKGQKAAVIYPIILSDRLEVMVKLPDQEQLYQYSPVRLSRDKIEKTLNEFQNNLRDEYKFKAVRESGQVVYNWLIKPVSQLLERSGVQTLLFILDDPLRTIPMSALYDGNHFLVEKYAVSLVLGLEVPNPTPLDRSQMKVLAASLTEPPPGLEQYAQLPNVNPELDEIEKAGVSVSSLRDKKFTIEAFKQKLNQEGFQVVHLATHGQFGADRNSTYLLTADGAIYVDELGELFSSLRKTQAQGIDLIVLSACRTAVGNDRVVFGIAGTAVRAGAGSAIAGLWSLADSSSVEFTRTLYQYLGQPNVTRAEALRQAQLALLNHPDYNHPRYWAPYVLVGDWL